MALQPLDALLPRSPNRYIGNLPVLPHHQGKNWKHFLIRCVKSKHQIAVTFLLLVFLASIDVVLELNANLPFCGLVADERMLQQMLRVRTLVIILDQDGFDEAVELFSPFLRLEAGRRIARNQEQSSHRMHVAQRRLGLGHFQCRDSQTPQIATIVIGSLRIVLTRNHLRRHPVGRTDESITTSDRSVQLSANTEIHCDGEK